MSDTPRIDEICKKRNCGYWGIPYKFACELERELEQTRSLLRKFQEISVTVDQRYENRIDKLEHEIEVLKAQQLYRDMEKEPPHPVETPRTDALSLEINGPVADLAKELERELTTCRQELADSQKLRHPLNLTDVLRLRERAESAESRNADLVKLIGQFDAAIRRIATELTGKACGGVDTGDNINPETGEPYGPGGHTGWLLAEEAKNLKAKNTQLVAQVAVR